MFIDFTQVNSGFDNTNELQPEACKSTAKLEGDVNPKDSADKLGLSNNNRVLIRWSLLDICTLLMIYGYMFYRYSWFTVLVSQVNRG